ncbi:MAG: PUR family DNA/RNA-binding protein [Bacteroidetes bacterium]|nr:PUR family DNA/RNA-binding protein [Bacteroidota bacterium]
MNQDGNTDHRYNDQQEIFSRPVKAGKRTYFFDVKATKGNDYYLTITESKKRFGDDGRFHYEKHKLFLYKEDFEKFADGLMEVINFIRENNPGGPPQQHHNHNGHADHNNTEVNHNIDNSQAQNPVSNDVSFEDLGNR